MSEEDSKLDPFVIAVRSIINSPDAKYFIEWLAMNQRDAVRDAASSTNKDDMLKISGRLSEYEYILGSINTALAQLQSGEIELDIGEFMFAKKSYCARRKCGFFSRVFLQLRTLFVRAVSSEPQHKI